MRFRLRVVSGCDVMKIDASASTSAEQRRKKQEQGASNGHRKTCDQSGHDRKERISVIVPAPPPAPGITNAVSQNRLIANSVNAVNANILRPQCPCRQCSSVTHTLNFTISINCRLDEHAERPCFNCSDISRSRNSRWCGGISGQRDSNKRSISFSRRIDQQARPPSVMREPVDAMPSISTEKRSSWITNWSFILL